MNVAISWPKNFLNGEITSKSSFSPIKKIIIEDGIRYCNSATPEKETNKTKEISTEAKIATPPSAGIGTWWTFLLEGSSYNFLTFAIEMITGVET